MNRVACSLTLVILACGCERSQSYYDDHASERTSILTGCRSGSVRGRDCANANASAAAARHSDAEQTFKNMSEGR